MSADEVYELMNRAGDLPFGEARTVLVEDALRRAEATGDERLAFAVRMELTSAYQHGGEPAKAFTTFSRCLSQHDADPGRFGDARRLLWHFKWVVNALTLFPEIPLDRTYAVLDDMERRYRLGGHSLQAVYHYRHAVARHVGDDEAADEWYAKWHAAPRDELSDCEGCDPTGKVRHLTRRGRHAEALELAAPVLGKELTCTEQPQNILTALLPAYLHTGRLEEAGTAHRRAYRLTRPNLRDLSDIADHIGFCAITGNEPRGLEILERHLDWLERSPSPYATMRFAAAAGLLLRRLADIGVEDQVRLRRGDAEVAAADLRAELTRQALELADRFDARNGTTRQGDDVRAVLEAEPLVEHLPLTPYARRPEPVAAQPEPVAADDPDALLDAAEAAWNRHEMAAAVAAWERFDELAPEPSPARAGRRADGRGWQLLVAQGEPQAALAEWERAADLHVQAGDEVRAEAARSRAGSLLCELDRVEEGVRRMRSALDRLDGLAPGSRRAASARLRLVNALVQHDRVDEAVALLETAACEDPAGAADLELTRARILALQGDPEGAAAAFRRACDGFRGLGGGALLAEAALMHAQLLIQTRREPGEHTDEVMSLLDEALRNAPAEMTAMRASAHGLRGSELMLRERPAEAVEDLVEAVAAYTAAGGFAQAAYARVDLAFAYLHAGRFLDAAEAAEEAGPMLLQLEDVQSERRCRYIVAEAQQAMGEEAAADTYTSLAGEERDDNPLVAASLLEKAADVLTGADKDALAAERYATAAEAFAAGGDPFGVVRTRRRAALCLSWSGRPEEAVEEITRARAALADLPGDNEAALTWENAVTGYDEARVLAGAGRLGEALTRVEEAIKGFTDLGETDAAATATAFRDQLTED
ncbi:tetratricopeptide repeat protein [Thermomonospora amylolytica]|uniref:hypothetical protein n=1 Tax=Thermomonospora amylolytica TaxID=1411117 RepID=UPI000E6B907E|nr:hypothetical protein [Thermomonospora amylolytica]